MAQPGHLRNQIAWGRLSDDVLQGLSDPSPGPNAPHIEIYWSQISENIPETNGQVPEPPDGQ
jgi:hypothetical protein